MTILWNEVTILWNEVVWNEVVMERSDRIPLGYIGYFACFSFTLSTIFIASIIFLSFIDSSLSTGGICGVVIGSVAGVCFFIILSIKLYKLYKLYQEKKENRVTIFKPS